MRYTAKPCPEHCPHGPFPVVNLNMSALEMQIAKLRRGVHAIRNGHYPRPANMPLRYRRADKGAMLKVNQMLDLIINTPRPIREAVCGTALHSQIGQAIGLAPEASRLFAQKVMKHKLELTFSGLRSWCRFYDVSFGPMRAHLMAVSAPPVPYHADPDDDGHRVATTTERHTDDDPVCATRMFRHPRASLFGGTRSIEDGPNCVSVIRYAPPIQRYQ